MRVLLLLLMLSTPCMAQGISMQGSPKYAAGFTQFDYVNAAAPKGGALRLSAIGTFDSTNPFIIKGTPPRQEQFNYFVFESLMYRSADEPFSVYPWLAERAEMADDRSAITFTLNAAARWQDGQPVTADDILFTVETLRTQGKPNHRSYYSKVERVTKINAYTVKFEFKKFDGGYDRELPLIIALMPILPKHYWANKVFNQTTLEPILGSGAYRIADVDAGRRITLQRVENYWAENIPALKGQQNFETITIDYFRDDSIAREALLAGAIDVRFESDPLKIKKAYKGVAVESGAVQLQRIAHQRPEPYKGIFLNTRRAPFNNAALRRALATAADFEQINRTLYGGEYKRSLSSFPNSILSLDCHPERSEGAPFANDKGVPSTSFACAHSAQDDKLERRQRLQQAKNILMQAGYTYAGGALVDAQKKPVAFEILIGDAADERLVLAWREAVKPLGITITIRIVDSAQFQSRLNDFSYDAVVFRVVNTLSPGNEQRVYWGSAAASTNGSRNYAGVRDAEIDRLVEQFLTAREYSQVIETAHAVDARLIDGAYVIPFFYLGADLVAKSRHIQCPATPPITGFEMRSCWYIK